MVSKVNEWVLKLFITYNISLSFLPRQTAVLGYVSVQVKETGQLGGGKG